VKSKGVYTALRYLIALGTIGYGVLSLVRSRRFAELTNMDEEAVNGLAMRDIGSGLQLLTAANPTTALMSRALYDFSDGAKLLRSRPSLAPIAFAWGLLAIATIITKPPGEDKDD
jgi:hypothetical protein